jgi:peptidoglycan/LPS O-acetylase OafA/YrhL
MNEQKIYFPALDGLRFFAFLVVFIRHTPLLPLPIYGEVFKVAWAGVDLFLCLSAYLFVHLLGLEWRKTGTIHVINFYIRRALRIWPAYFLCVGIFVILILITNGFTSEVRWRVFGYSTFTSNIINAIFNFKDVFPVSLLRHLWTISYEEQFYLVIPWFLLFMFRIDKRKQAFVLSLIFVAGLCIRAAYIYLKVPYPAIYVLPITHFEAVLLGLCVGLGVLQFLIDRINWWVAALAGITFFIPITFMPTVTVTSWWLMPMYVLIGLGSASFLIMALKSNEAPNMRWLASKPLVYLGKISYGLYLYHFSIIWFVQKFFEKITPALSISDQVKPFLIFFLALAITIASASLSYQWIEKPFLKMKGRFSTIQTRPF